MEGYVEVYRNRNGENELIHSDHNMVVDGARRHIADFFATPPPPRAIEGVCSSLDTSNFNIRAFTLGSAKDNYDFRHTRFYPSSLDSETYVSGFYNLLPYLHNYNYNDYAINEFSPYPNKVNIVEDSGMDEIGIDILQQFGKNFLNINDVGTFTSFHLDSQSLEILVPDGWTSNIDKNDSNTGLPTGNLMEPNLRTGGLRIVKNKSRALFRMTLDQSTTETFLESGVTGSVWYKLIFDCLEYISGQLLIWDHISGGRRINPKLGRNEILFNPKAYGPQQRQFPGFLRLGTVTDTTNESPIDVTIDNIQIIKLVEPPLKGYESLGVPIQTLNSGEWEWWPDPFAENNNDQAPLSWEVTNKDYTSNLANVLNHITSSTFINTNSYTVVGAKFKKDTDRSTEDLYMSYKVSGDSSKSVWNFLDRGTYKLDYSILKTNGISSQLHVDRFDSDGTTPLNFLETDLTGEFSTQFSVHGSGTAYQTQTLFPLTIIATGDCDCVIDNITLFKETGSADQDPKWEVVTKGSPTLTADQQGLVFKSTAIDDQSVISQDIPLKRGRSYRANITASGTDDISIRIRRNDPELPGSVYEYFDFDKRVFIQTSDLLNDTGQYYIPFKSLSLDKQVKTYTFEFSIPEYEIDTSAFSDELTEYLFEVVLPEFGGDLASDVYISRVELLDLEEQVLKNSEFIEVDSIIPNSDLQRRKFGPDYVRDSGGNKGAQLGIVDFSGATPDQWRGDFYSTRGVYQWDTVSHSPIVDSTNAAADIESASGSVTYKVSSVDLPRIPNEGYVEIRAKDSRITNPGTEVSVLHTLAHLGSKFSLSGSYFDDAFSNTDGIRDVPLLLTFWYNSNHNDDENMGVKVFAELASREEEYTFSSFTDSATSTFHRRGEWVDSTDVVPLTVLPSPTDAWEKISEAIILKSDFFDGSDPTFKIQFHGNGTNSNSGYSSYRIKGLSLSPVPGWSYANLNGSSNIGLTSSNTAIVDLSSHGGDIPSISQEFSGIMNTGDYNLVVRYKSTEDTTTNIFDVNLSGAVGTTKYHYDWDWLTSNSENKANAWTTTSTPKSFYGTGGSWTTSSFVVTEFDTIGFKDYTEGQKYMLSLLHKNDSRIELDYVRLIQSRRLPYTGPFEASTLGSPVGVQYISTSRYRDGIGIHLDTESKNQVLINLSSSSTGKDPSGGYVELTHYYAGTTDDLNTGPYFYFKQKDLNIKKNDVLSFMFGHYAQNATSPFRVFLAVYDVKTGSKIFWNPNTGSWDPNFQSKTFPLNTTDSDYPFQINELSGITVTQPEHTDDSVWVFKTDLTKFKTDTMPVSYRVSPVKVYKTGQFVEGLGIVNREFSYASALPCVDASPMDYSLQPPSLDGSGPDKLGHFLNYIEFSSTSQTSSMPLERVLQHGCYLPGAGLEMGASSFGHVDDPAIDNSYSGVISGTLNQYSVITSDGYILETSGSNDVYDVKDASSGFVVSAIPPATASAMGHADIREVKYVLTLTATDWNFLDYYYGGVGAIGMHVFDYARTAANNGGDTANPPFLDTTPGSQSTGSPYSTSLYNLTDSSKDPVFNLFSKKIFFPGGLKIPEGSDYNDYITIVWGIKF